VYKRQLSDCGSIKTSYDYDKTVDFTKFKTYNYTQEALMLPIQELNRNRILAAVDKEMAGKGLTKSDSPDIWVDLQVKAEQRQEATATSTGGAGMYGYGRGYRYGGGMSTTNISVENYVDGTLFVNMVNDDKLVWQGRATKTLDEDATAEQKERNINDAVKMIFAKYPPAKK
jgi:hypothetical protein